MLMTSETNLAYKWREMIIRFCYISYIFMLSQHLFSGLTWDKIPAQNAKIMI